MVLNWIDQQAALDDLVAIISESPAITLDTEFVRVSTFHPRPGLIQVGLNAKAFLIDPLVGLDLNQLGDLLSGCITSVLHAAQEDYEVLFRLTGQLPGLVFDTQVAYALLNLKISPSLSTLVSELLGREISKQETRSDWTRRPLSEAQCQYAKDDVLVLEPLYEILSEQLEKAGRQDWMQEEMQSIRDRNASILVDGDLETQIYKFGNAWRLSPTGMSRLVHLVKWREKAARRLDRPRKHVLSDQSVFSLATSGDVGRHHQLVGQHGLSDKQADRYGEQLKSVIEHATSVETVEPPPPPLSKHLKNEFKERQTQVEGIARELGIAPEMLLKKRQLVASMDGREWRPTGWRKVVLEDVFHASG
jgi:ribonuclease D